MPAGTPAEQPAPVPAGASAELATAAAARPSPPRPRRIYVNRNLRLDSIRAIGFDMDHTLARYRRQALESLAFRITLDKLLRRGYPEAIRAFTYDATAVVRGLTVDTQLGNILKLDRHGHPARVVHGGRPLGAEERRSLYRREKIRFVPPRFAVVDTLFSLPEICLYAQLVAYFDAHPAPEFGTTRLFEDTRDCIDEAHRDDSLKAAVRADLPTYLEVDPDLPRTLHKLRSAGKRLFLLTNSLHDYTCALMRYLLDGKLAEYPSWSGYFDAVVVGADKPGFFTGAAEMTGLSAQGTQLPRPAARARRGATYAGGSLRAFERALGCSGEEVLYVGDHIYGDILRSKKTSLWRTALIVEELEDEIAVAQAHAEPMRQLLALERERQRLDDMANAQRLALAAQEALADPAGRRAPRFEQLKAERDATKQRLRVVAAEEAALDASMRAAFNSAWGMVFKEGRENSRFGEQVAEYACLYTSRVSNFLNYSSYQYFRCPRDLLPHERD